MGAHSWSWRDLNCTFPQIEPSGDMLVKLKGQFFNCLPLSNLFNLTNPFNNHAELSKCAVWILILSYFNHFLWIGLVESRHVSLIEIN